MLYRFRFVKVQNVFHYNGERGFKERRKREMNRRTLNTGVGGWVEVTEL